MVENAIPLGTKIVVGSCTFALHAMGSDAMPVFFAIFGAYLGNSFAPPMPFWRMVGQVAAITIVCSLLGAWIALERFDDHLFARCGCAVLLAMFFYPLWTLVTNKLPRLFDLAEEAVRQWFRLPPKGGDAP